MRMGKGTSHCVQCNIEFVNRRPNGRQCKTNKNPNLFCSRKCAATWAGDRKRVYSDEAAAKRAYNQRKRARTPIVQTPCVECGVMFVPVTGRLSCSDPCKQKHRQKMSDATTGRSREPRICVGCWKPFDPVYGSWRQKWCSNECQRVSSKLATRAKRRGATGVIEVFNPIAILERDGWRCYMCGVPTPSHLRGTMVDEAPEVEHIISLANGGDHTPANTACACRACNMLKGDALQHFVM